MPEILPERPPEVTYPTRVNPAALFDHYREEPTFVHWWSRAGQAGVLYRVNCATCGACWLELRTDGLNGPPKQVIFLDEDGEQRMLNHPFDAVSLLGATV